MVIPAPAKIRRALFAVLLCAAAPAQAQAPIGFFVEKVTGTSLSVVNAPFAGGAVTYSWTPPAAKNGGPLEGYILHVREKPATPTAWPERSAEWDTFTNVLPAGVEVSGIETVDFGGDITLALGSGLRMINLPGATTYQARIRGHNTEFEFGHWSDISEFFIAAAPAGLSVSRSGNTISASWNAVADATNYKIRWARRGQDWINPNGGAGEDAGATSYQITNLVAGQSYNLAVRADTAGGPGAWSETVNQRGQTLSSNAALSELVLTDASGAGLLTFDPNDAERRYFPDDLATEHTSVRVKATAADATASINIQTRNNNALNVLILDRELASGALSPLIPISSGAEDFAIITLEVSAEDGATSLQYELNIGRIGDEATIQELEIYRYDNAGNSAEENVGVFIPAFVPDDDASLVYRVEVPNEAHRIAVVVKPTKAGDVPSIRFVSGSLDETNTFAETAGAASSVFSLTAGQTRTMRITLTAQDRTTTLQYTLHIVRLGSGSDNNRLQNLAVAHSGGAVQLRKVGGDGSADFASTHVNYAATVESTVNSITLTPTASHAGATLTLQKIGGAAAAVASGSASAGQSLDYGENNFEIAVFAQNHSRRIYTLEVTRTPQSDDATLRALAVSAGSLSPAFDAATTSYNLLLENSVSQLTLTPTVNESHASVTVAGTAVTSGEASAAQTLSVGENKINIVVTAENGDTQTYVVAATRAVPAASTNADLSALTIAPGTLSASFASGTTTYSATLADTDASVRVTPTTDDAGASVEVNGEAVASGAQSSAIALAPGESKTIRIVVTAEDSTTKKTYTITVRRPLSGNSALSALAVSAGSLSPAFDAGVLNYTAAVEHSTASITLTPTAAHSAAGITVAGAAVTSGEASAAQNLQVGENRIEIIVTAQDKTTSTYVVAVTRARSPDATLRALSLSAGTLVPNFAPETGTYTADVPNSAANVTVTPTTNHPDATVTVAGTTVASGTASAAQSLTVGENTIVVAVTAHDGVATKDYTLRITRAPFVASSDANLSALSIDPGSIAETFAANTLAYTAALENSAENVRVTPTVNDANASVTVDGNSVDSGTPSGAIALAANVPKAIPIVVTAQDAGTKTYTLTVTRAPGPPGVPRDVTLQAGNALARGTWKLPANENGSPVTTYNIRWKLKTDSNFADSADVTGTSRTLPGLAAGEWQLQVRAVNAEGAGEYSDSAEGEVRAYNADVDEVGGVTLHDGLLLSRYLLGVRGDKLTDKYSGEPAVVIEENAKNGVDLDLLDVNESGAADFNDGVLITRYAAGLRGNALLNGVAQGASPDTVLENLAKLGL